MTDTPSIPDKPVEADEQWCMALLMRIVKASPGGILEKDLHDAFVKAFTDAVKRGEVYLTGRMLDRAIIDYFGFGVN
jgi:hypothetical protein